MEGIAPLTEPLKFLGDETPVVDDWRDGDGDAWRWAWEGDAEVRDRRGPCAELLRTCAEPRGGAKEVKDCFFVIVGCRSLEAAEGERETMGFRAGDPDRIPLAADGDRDPVSPRAVMPRGLAVGRGLIPIAPLGPGLWGRLPLAARGDPVGSVVETLYIGVRMTRRRMGDGTPSASSVPPLATRQAEGHCCGCGDCRTMGEEGPADRISAGLLVRCEG